MTENAVPEGARVVRRTDVLWRSAPGFLVVSTIDGEAFTAEGGAAQVWDHLTDPVTVDQLCAELAELHSVGLEQMRADVPPFVDQLIEAGYVEVLEATDD